MLHFFIIDEGSQLTFWGEAGISKNVTLFQRWQGVQSDLWRRGGNKQKTSHFFVTNERSQLTFGGGVGISKNVTLFRHSRGVPTGLLDVYIVYFCILWWCILSCIIIDYYYGVWALRKLQQPPSSGTLFELYFRVLYIIMYHGLLCITIMGCGAHTVSTKQIATVSLLWESLTFPRHDKWRWETTFCKFSTDTFRFN